MEENIGEFAPTNEQTVEQDTTQNPESSQSEATVVEEVDELLAKNKQLYERAKKAEAELKQFKASKSVAPTTEKTQDSNIPSRDELILFAKGFTDEDIQQIGILAKVKNITLAEASKSDEFIAIKETRERKQKSEEASLRASRSSQSREKKSFDTQGLSDDEHKRLWMERQKG